MELNNKVENFYNKHRSTILLASHTRTGLESILRDLFQEMYELGYADGRKPTDEDIKSCIAMCLTDANEQRFKDYDTNLKDCLAWLEKKDMKKPTDKVEPKFKQGEWIVWKDKYYKVNYNGCGYELFDKNGLSTSWGYKTIEDNAHLWTIQDAKDGDVLACENGWTCIFRCLNDNLFSSYCFMDNEYWFCEDGGQAHTLDKRICGEIHPATKEQRDLLFQKMKEAGYGWDTDKKKLRVKPKFKVGDYLVNDYCKGKVIALTDDAYLLDTEQGIPFSCEHNAHLWTIKDAKDGDILSTDCGNIFIYTGHDDNYVYYCATTNYYDDAIIEKSTWNIANGILPASKSQINFLISKIKEKGYDWDAEKKELKKIYNALEECEIENIEHGKYYYCIKDYFAGGKKQASKGDVVQALRGLPIMGLGVKANEYFIPVNSIKVGKPAWSEDDDKMLIDAIGAVGAADYYTYDDKQEIENWLKSLKEKLHPQWKPSEEQIQALEYQVHSTYEGSWQHWASKELLEQLKKL